MAFDRGEAALGNRLALARDRAELELIGQQARKAIAVTKAEALHPARRSIEFLTGAMFESDRLWRRLVGMSLADVMRGRPRAGPQRSAERARVGRVEPKQPEQYAEGDQEL